jgi:hypothetical protein
MSNVFTRFVRDNAKKLVITSAFVLAMVSAVGLGLATKQFTSAAGGRDSGHNPIFNADTNGGIGCLTAKECVLDLKQNKPGDIQTIYNYFGLSPSEYSRFESTARLGKTMRNGDVVVDGQVVMTNSYSMGRDTFHDQTAKKTIGNATYYYGKNGDVFAAGTQSIDTFVMFDSKGVVETAMMTACGNPVWGNNVTPEYDCKALQKKQVAKDTYDFTTDVVAKNNATVNKVVYDFGDGTGTVTKTNPAEAVRHKYDKPGTWTAKVTVYFNLPGKQVVVVPAVKCATKIVVEQPPKPYYACNALTPTTLNDEKTKFRFTVTTNQGNGAILKDADFTLDTTSTVTGVTTKDASGNIYKEYTFTADGKDHTVVAKVNFNVANAVQSVTCQAKITSGKTPECKPGIPVGSPQCEEQKQECKPGIPVGSSECVETPPAELPKTGMGNMLGIFAGTSAIGAVGHRLFMNRRRNG